MKTLEQEYRRILTNLVKKENSYIIYPFGKGGRIVKKILNIDFQIEEKFVVDNGLADKGANCCEIKSIENPNDYVWILGCIDKNIHGAIIETLEGIVDKTNRIDLFEIRENDKIKKYSNNGYKLLCKIEENINNKACDEFIELIAKKKGEGKKICVAEIGVGVGATAVAACSLLDKEDTYYGFDFEEVVSALEDDLKKNPYVDCEIKIVGNSHKLYDSYGWNLSDKVYAMREGNKQGLFDVVYLDAAHNFEHDGLACCLLKELTKVGGYIVFDDLNWSYGYSVTGNPIVRPNITNCYDDKQIYDCQVRRVVNMFMVNDYNWKEVYFNGYNSDRAIYQKMR